jgi:apoptosis-inducing factor 2
MNTMHAQPDVVIYGGGMAGAILAKNLCIDCNVTLVDSNDYFEVPMAAPRSLVTPDFASRSIIPLKLALPNVQLVRGTLKEFHGSTGIVSLPDGNELRMTATVTVLATGSSFSNPLMRATNARFEERQAFYAKFQTRLIQASRILIVGGGPIGVEVAGEISDNYPNKSITILNAGPRILMSTSEEAAQHAAAVLHSRGVHIICNEKLTHAESPESEVFAPAGEALTSSGRTISYDLIIWCIGGKPNTDYMEVNYPNLLDKVGRIRVTPHLRVTGMSSVFALGDITNLDENKMAWHVTPQVKNVAFNIRKVLKGRTADSELRTHRPRTGNPMMAISIGRHTGVSHLPLVGVVRISWLNRLAKAGHMLVPKYRKILGI